MYGADDSWRTPSIVPMSGAGSRARNPARLTGESSGTGTGVAEVGRDLAKR